MASITKHVRFGTDICLMPFNHPIRLAEDLAALKYSSSLGLGGVVYAVLFVCWRALDGRHARGLLPGAGRRRPV